MMEKLLLVGLCLLVGTAVSDKLNVSDLTEELKSIENDEKGKGNVIQDKLANIKKELDELSNEKDEHAVVEKAKNLENDIEILEKASASLEDEFRGVQLSNDDLDDMAKESDNDDDDDDDDNNSIEALKGELENDDDNELDNLDLEDLELSDPAWGRRRRRRRFWRGGRRFIPRIRVRVKPWIQILKARAMRIVKRYGRRLLTRCCYHWRGSSQFMRLLKSACCISLRTRG